ncbi:MAG: DUF3253 domain-containing protein [Casimicrobium sp.]
MTGETDIAREILRQCKARAPDRSICPSEVARALWLTDWEPHMSEVRAEGFALATAGKIVITQGGEARRPSVSIRGPIRYRLAPP